MATLEATQQRLLENAPDNPNSPKKAEAASSRPGSSFSRSTTAPPRPSLRETMAAQKKAALANKTLPARPGSAMSALSPMRAVSSTSTSSASEAAPVRMRPETTSIAHGGLSVAPMRPSKMRSRPEISRPEIARPATAGPYSVRRPIHAPTNSDSAATTSPSASRTLKTRTPSASSTSPRKLAARPNTSHSSYASQSNITSPAKSTASRIPTSPRSSPGKARATAKLLASSSPAKADEDFTMVVPTVSGVKEHNGANDPKQIDSSDDEELVTPLKSMKVYEDPFSNGDDQTTPRPTLNAPVLEEVPVNEDASNLARNSTTTTESTKALPMSPERSKQNSRLLDSGINKIKAKSLDVHGFRKLQGMIRDNKAAWTDNKFDTLLLGLFEFLEAPLASLTPDKVQDVKAQILATINLMYKKDRDSFVPHVSRGLESILVTRSCYDARAHIVSGLELLADQLVTLADPAKTVDAMITQLNDEQMTLEGCRVLSMGLHMLKELLDAKSEFTPSEEEVGGMCRLAARCLESSESGVRMDAVQLCVSLHSRLGESGFWKALGGVREDPKSLITYYIVKKQREMASSS
jgi:CLIP-associating protein 1/2